MCPATTPTVTVQAQNTEQKIRAIRLAERLGLDLDDDSAEFVLVVTDAGLQLSDRTRREQPLRLDFGKLIRQRGPATARSLLGRASGIRRSGGMRVLDCTGGLGRDACMLATLGAASVVVMERNPVLVALLEDALTRGRAEAETRAWLGNMRVESGDALEMLGGTSACAFDVVYVDPMFPRGRRALAGRELQLLQRLLGDEEQAGDAEVLVAAALASGCRRVVIKRAKHQRPVAAPTFEAKGKSFRFDVYVNPGGGG